jgi:hypothetical protein
MEQDYLLLMVLGVLVFGMAIVVALNVFLNGSVNQSRDALITDLRLIASLAHMYYLRPTLTGKNKNFIGWKVPSNLIHTKNITSVKVGSVTQDSITLVGYGSETGKDGASKVRVTMVIGPKDITSTTINN